MSKKRGVVFLDRDGTIIEDEGYLREPQRVRVLKGSPEAIRLLKSNGFSIYVVSNQSGIGRGYFTEEDLKKVQGKIEGELKKSNAAFDGFYYCPHPPEVGCLCRKPKTRMLEEIARDKGADLASSYMIGDATCDVQLALKVGCRALLVLTGKGRESLKELENLGVEPDFVAADLLESAKWILKEEECRRK